MKWLVVFALLGAALLAAPAVQASHVSCGQTITTDTTLDGDLVCSDRGILIGAAGITLDLNGHRITGQGSPRTTGIDNTGGHDGVRIENGLIANFQAGVRLTNAESNRIAALSITGRGVELINSHRNTLTGLAVNTTFGTLEVNLVESNENSLVENTDTGIRLDLNADRNQITNNTGGQFFAFNGSDDNVFTGNRDVVMDLRDSMGMTITGNEPRIIDMSNVDHSVIASNDIVGSAHLFGLRIAGSSDVTIEQNRVVDPLPPTNNNIGFARSALLLTQSPDNVVVDNEFSGYEVGIELSGETDRNLISGNLISDHDLSGIRLYLADDNSIVSNELSSNGEYGVEFQLASNLNRIEDNEISGSGIDGVLVSAARSQGNLFAGNTVDESGDDGIDVDVANNTITSDSVFHNADWGIEAVAGDTDGGGNRGWSNGQPAQCLNVVCGPGPPASLSLSPQSATNTVGDQHCVTATVADPDGRPTAGVTVRFSVDGDGSAAGQTDAGGTATFCYDGPLAPGTQLIAAFADTDTNGAQDPGEPGDTATKTWVVPASNSCRAIGKGTLIAANGDEASFDLNVRITGGRLRGRLIYRDPGPAERLTARSRAIEALTCSANTASTFGTALVTGSSHPVRFRIDVSESPDTYRIRLGNGYDSGEAVISSGKIKIR